MHFSQTSNNSFEQDYRFVDVGESPQEMMKTILLIGFVGLFGIISRAQLSSGFEPAEARDMIALCNSFTFLDLYGSDEEIIPEGYELVHTSSIIGMDNLFQVYRKGEVGVINLRGSTAHKDSWMENFYSVMIPAQDTIVIDSLPHPYVFGKEDSCSVHAGYALAIAFLVDSVEHQIHELRQSGVRHFLITCHSQGGALAQLLMAYVHHHPDSRIRDNFYKTYAFASPKPGNKIFAQEYTKNHKGYSYDVINPADLIPRFPFHYNDTDIVSKEDLRALFKKDESFNLKQKIGDGTKRMFEIPMRGTFRLVGSSAFRQIYKDVADVQMPKSDKDLNFFRLDSIVELERFDYPKILLDSAILDNPRSAKWPRDSLGYFKNDEFYRQEPKSWQHKPYNYYVMVLKMYFPEQYEALEKKYLMENI